MTPFDPVALVAMLRVFYPAVSAGAFARARSERPEYFAGGRIIGTGGDKLQLPDLRIFDCIFAVDGPAAGRRWQANDVTDAGGGDPDPFALEAGPLEPIDEDTVIVPGDSVSFESLVAGGLAQLDGADAVLDGAGQAIVTFDGAAVLERGYRDTVEPAAIFHASLRAALDNDDPSDVVNATNAHDPEIDAARGEYVETPPPDTPEPDPGDPPGDGPPKPPPDF